MVDLTYYDQKYAKEENGDDGESEALREVKKNYHDKENWLISAWYFRRIELFSTGFSQQANCQA